MGEPDMGISPIVESLALRAPWLARSGLWCASRIDMRLRRQPHWLVARLAAKLDYRAPVIARLGNGMKIRVPWMDDGGRAVYEAGWYEQETVQVISGLLRPGSIFLDIGAGFGQYTLLAAGAVGRSGSVHAFEPEPVSFRWLKGNVERNRLENVTLAQIALGDSIGSVQLFVGSPENLGTTSLRQQYNFAGRSVSVALKPLDQYVAQAGLQRVDVIKMDVEGAESLVLRGAERVLAMRPAMVLEFEESNQARFGSSCAKLARMLTEKGYRLESLLGGERVPYQASQSKEHYSFNVVATPA